MSEFRCASRTAASRLHGRSAQREISDAMSSEISIRFISRLRARNPAGRNENFRFTSRGVCPVRCLGISAYRRSAFFGALFRCAFARIIDPFRKTCQPLAKARKRLCDTPRVQIVFDAALPRQKHPEASNASPRADQSGRMPAAISASLHLRNAVSQVTRKPVCKR